jgi:hypothetical protein
MPNPTGVPSGKLGRGVRSKLFLGNHHAGSGRNGAVSEIGAPEIFGNPAFPGILTEVPWEVSTPSFRNPSMRAVGV